VRCLPCGVRSAIPQARKQTWVRWNSGRRRASTGWRHSIGTKESTACTRQCAFEATVICSGHLSD
jgi:hypothetical protein